VAYRRKKTDLQAILALNYNIQEPHFKLSKSRTNFFQVWMFFSHSKISLEVVRLSNDWLEAIRISAETFNALLDNFLF